MGTRNLTMVKLGEKLFGQYGQWDGYPSGNGVEVLDFLQDHFDEPKFKAAFEKVNFVPDDEVEKVYNDLAKAGVKDDLNPMTREMGTGILEYIQTAEEPKLFNSISFAADSLFCEWAYLVDLDERKLRVFQGFNQSPLEDGQLFASEIAKTLGVVKENPSYYPIREVGALTFDELATVSHDEFVQKFEPKEEE